MLKTIDVDQTKRIIEGGESTLFMVIFHVLFCPACPSHIENARRVIDRFDELNIKETEVFLCDCEEDGPQKDFADGLNIRFFPTTLFFKEGVVLNEAFGYREDDQILLDILSLPR